ncbi:hypothetical protein AtubIFM55763_001400 [Aspergillus tubingensis]|nr:hypothetical protein AtubIFM55763_001400 [Aspergillus tubingensis]
MARSLGGLDLYHVLTVSRIPLRTAALEVQPIQNKTNQDFHQLGCLHGETNKLPTLPETLTTHHLQSSAQNCLDSTLRRPVMIQAFWPDNTQPERTVQGYKRLQALRTVLGLETSHAETSRIQCVQDPVRIGAGSYAVGSKDHEIAQRDDDDPAAVNQSSASPSRTADDYLNGWKASLREQKQWNQDFEETVHQIHQSLFGSGTKKGTTRGKATSS